MRISRTPSTLKAAHELAWRAWIKAANQASGGALEFASAAEVIAGAEAAKAVTPNGLTAAGVTALLARMSGSGDISAASLARGNVQVGGADRPHSIGGYSTTYRNFMLSDGIGNFQSGANNVIFSGDVNVQSGGAHHVLGNPASDEEVSHSGFVGGSNSEIWGLNINGVWERVDYTGILFGTGHKSHSDETIIAGGNDITIYNASARASALGSIDGTIGESGLGAGFAFLYQSNGVKIGDVTASQYSGAIASAGGSVNGVRSLQFHSVFADVVGDRALLIGGEGTSAVHKTYTGDDVVHIDRERIRLHGLTKPVTPEPEDLWADDEGFMRLGPAQGTAPGSPGKWVPIANYGASPYGVGSAHQRTRYHFPLEEVGIGENRYVSIKIEGSAGSTDTGGAVSANYEVNMSCFSRNSGAVERAVERISQQTGGSTITAGFYRHSDNRLVPWVEGPNWNPRISVQAQRSVVSSLPGTLDDIGVTLSTPIPTAAGVEL